MWAEKLHWGIGWGGNFYKEKETTRYEKSVRSKTFLIRGKVIKKNIEERKEMVNVLGLDRLADDLRQTSKGFINNLDLMYKSYTVYDQ